MSTSDLVVLGFLRIKPMHGYEIVNFAKTRGLDVWAGVKMPSVYNALQRLDKKDFVIGERKTEKNNPPRTVYTITESGINHLRKIILRSFQKKTLLPQDFWLIISFIARNITKKDFLNVLNNRIAMIVEHIPKHTSMCNELSDGVKYSHVPFYMKTLISMGAETHKIELTKLKEIRDEVLTGNQDHLFISEEE